MGRPANTEQQIIRVSITDDIYWLLVQEGAVDHLSATRKAAEIIREWAALKKQGGPTP